MKTKRTVAILFFIFFLVYFAVSIIQHIHFRTYGDDLGLFEQAIWHYSRFEVPVSSIREVPNILGDHFHPILISIVPLYWIWKSPVTLLFVQSLLLALSIFPIFWFAREKLDNYKAVAITVIYGTFWGIQNTIGFDFHEIAFAVPVIAFAIYYINAKKPYIYFPLLLLLLLVKEDMSLLVVFFGIYLIVRSKKYIQGAILMLIGLISFYVLTTIVIPHFAGSSGFTYWHYTEFGKNLPTAIAYMVSHPIYTIKVLFSPNKKLITELFTFIPFLFIPFLSPIFILSIPLLLERFLSTESAYWGFHGHYSATVSPILIMAVIEGLAFLMAKMPKLLAKYKEKVIWVIISLMLIINVGSIAIFPFNQLFQSNSYSLSSSEKAGYQALSLIPPNASVIAQNPIVSHLAERDNIHILKSDNSLPANPDYILASSSIDIWPYSSFSQINTYLNMKIKKGYIEIFHKGGWVVLKSPALEK